MLTPASNASAAQANDVPAGSLLVTREVGPRNAIHPTNGSPNAVQVAPGSQAFGAIGSSIRQIGDLDAAGVSAGPAVRSIVGNNLQLDLGKAASSDLALSRQSSGGGAGGIGGTIGSALGSGLGALQSALGSVRGGGQ